MLETKPPATRKSKIKIPSKIKKKEYMEGSSCTSIMTCTGGCGYSF